MYKRILDISLITSNSCFLFGPRQTGKSTFLEGLPFDLRYNLLISNEFLRLNRDPDILLRECSTLDRSKKQMVWIDEIQKIPALLDVVHHCMEKFKNIVFTLSGSSARTLRKQGVNLLGGRALDIKFHPLTIAELGKDFNLSHALEYGTLPRMYSPLKDGNTSLTEELLRSYVSTYLEEEIKKESLVRDLQPFQRFLEVAAQSVGNIVNLSNISDEAQISLAATKNYFSILEDTLIGFFLPAYHKSVRKQLTKHPKFYLFDNGVTRAISNILGSTPSGLEKGTLFEQFVIQEIRRINDCYRKNFKLYFWRTESNAEVDLLITKGKEILLAIECKASPHVRKRDLSGLKAFHKEHPKVKTYVCAPVEREIEIDTGFHAISIHGLVKKLVDM